MRKTSLDILIVGGGIIGLATAIALQTSSAGELCVAVADGRLGRAPNADGRALALTASSRRLLQAIGAWPAIAPHAEPMLSIALSDARLDDVVRPLLLGFPEASLPGEPFAHVVPTENILGSLLDRAEALGIALWASPLQALDPGAGGAAFRLSDGRAGVCRLAVAADGGNSPTRRAAKIACFRWSYAQHALVTTVKLASPHGGRAFQVFLPGGPFALLPLPGDRAAVVWSEAADTAVRLSALPDEAFLEELARRAGPDLGELALAGPRASFPLTGMIARAFTADRLMLAGDAARILHPIAGQGVNVGLRDAAALTEIVIHAARLGLDIGDAIQREAYERWRRFDSAALLAATDALNRLFRIDGPASRTVRDAGLSLLDRMPAMKRQIVRAAAGMAGETPRLLLGELP